MLDGVSSDRSREQKYEEKRLQFLAAKRGSSSDEPRVRFQDSQHTQGAHAVSGRVTEIPDDASSLRGERNASTQHQSYEQGVQPHVGIQHTAGVHESTVRNPTRPQLQESIHRQSLDRQQVPEQDLFCRQQSSTTAIDHQPKADYAKQLQEQKLLDLALAAAQHEIETGHLSPATSITPPAQGQSLRHVHEVSTEGADTAASSVVDRKAEYARLLREQMAADKATKFATETERKRRAVPTSSGVLPAGGAQEEHSRGDGGDEVGAAVRNAKAEYAQQLRDQMAAKEHAQRVSKGLGGGSNSSNAGPSWIEGATEGREARRKRSNAAYADQLRAQIAAQNSNNLIEQSRIASWVQPPKDSFRQPGRVEEQQQQQQQGSGDARYMEQHKRGPERQSRSGRQGSREVEPSHRRLEGERNVAPFQGEAHNALALER